MEIFNVLGEKVYQQTLNYQNETLNLNLPGGMYFYQVKDNKQFISTGKLIIK